MEDEDRIDRKRASWRLMRRYAPLLLEVFLFGAAFAALFLLGSNRFRGPVLSFAWGTLVIGLTLLGAVVGFRREVARRWRKWRRPTRAAFAVGVAVLVVATPVAATLLLTQTVPVVTAAAILSTTCTSGANPLTANVSFYIVGVTSYIRFTCTVDGHGYQTKGGIVATPTFTLPTGPSQLWSYESSTAAGGVCSAGTGAWQMTSGSGHTFPSAVKDWDYCMVIPNTATVDIAQYTVAWDA